MGLVHVLQTCYASCWDNFQLSLKRITCTDAGVMVILVLVGAEVMMYAFSAMVAVRVDSTGASIRVDIAVPLLMDMVDMARATTVEVLHSGQ